MGQPRVGRRAVGGLVGRRPAYHRPVFVITHHEREPLHKSDTTFTFVTDGIESALEQARQAAGDRDIALGGGADVAQQYLGQSATPARTAMLGEWLDQPRARSQGL